MKIVEIQESLRQGLFNTDPHGAAEATATLAGEYSWMCGQLEEILVRKPAVWIEIRKDVKSDTAAERAWQNTPSGIDEQGLRLRMKGIEKMMSSLKTLVRLAEQEIHNNL